MARTPKLDSLAAHRRRLDDLDQRLMELILERAVAVRAVARLKRTAGQPLIDPDREAEIIDALRARAAGQLPDVELDNFIDALRELMQGVVEEPEH